MSQLPLRPRKAAVLGAGVMGAQIAAHLANADVETLLFDLPAKEGDKNGIALKAIAQLAKLSPAPLADPSRQAGIRPANYDEHLESLRDCDLVIEAIAERLDWKLDLYTKIAPYLSDSAVVASNTSGLSIATLAAALPASLQPRFSGIHFFNPPRYMHLVELVPHPGTDRGVLARLEAFLTTTLGKGVVHAKDTPNFIGNRIGVFSILATMHHTAQSGLAFDLVDALTGPAIGRPKSATYRTADVVGLDTMAHVIKTMADTLPEDPWHAYFKSPAWLQALVAKGALGQKSGAGIYAKRGKDITVVDLASQDYVPAGAKPSDEVAAILALKDPAARFAQLRASGDPQAQFLWAVFRDLFHYSAFHLSDIADTARDVDFAIRWGYGWKLGPFETWQSAGWAEVAKWIAEDIAAGKAMSSAPLPDWVGRIDGAHHAEGSWSPRSGRYEPRSTHPVYARQLYPDALLGEKPATGTTLWENDGVRLWSTGDDGIGILSFKTKMNTVNDAVLEGIQEAIGYAERTLQALVIWQESDKAFSAGADLKGMLGFVQGPASVIAYVIVGIPLARLVDIFPRKYVLSGGIALIGTITALGGFAQERLELGEDLLDGVQVGAVGRQEDEVSADGFDGGAGGLALVAAEVVEDDHVARLEGRSQDLLDVDQEELAVDGAIDHPGGVDAITAQGGDEGLGLPVAERSGGLETLAARSPATQGRHVGLHPGLVDEHQAGGADPALVGLPARPSPGHVRPGLLLGQQGFF